ncbi:MAG: TetR/AcrR family transcriptional regulator [Actinomycetota bacterium]
MGATRKSETIEPDAPRTGGARDRILDAAGGLFYEHGFAAVGIDRIIAEAGVAKASLYAHFGSKDDLVVAYLRRSDEAFWDWIDGSVDADADPATALVEIFAEIEKQATSPGCHGCTFQVTAAEFPDRTHPAHRAAADHKRSALQRFEELADAAGLRDPAVLAAHLVLVMDGAWAATRMFGAENHGSGLAELAGTLVESHR